MDSGPQFAGGEALPPPNGGEGLRRRRKTDRLGDATLATDLVEGLSSSWGTPRVQSLSPIGADYGDSRTVTPLLC